MEQHFAEMAKEVEERFLTSDSKVLETGSNDGIMLKAFKNNKVLGVEPSHNVADVAIQQGVDTIKDFFTENLANIIVQEKGKEVENAYFKQSMSWHLKQTCDKSIKLTKELLDKCFD